MSFIGDLLGANSQEKVTAQNVYAPSNDQLQNTVSNQNAFVNALQAQAAGTGGPSAAQAMFQRAGQQNAAQANSLAASQQGNVNAGLATRNAQMMAAQGNQNIAGQAAQMRSQEQLNAQNMLGGQLNTMFNQGVNAQGMNQAAGLQAGNINANTAAFNAKQTGDITGGLLKGGAGALSMLLAHGGEVPRYADGGEVSPLATPTASAPDAGPSSFVGKMAKGMLAPSVSASGQMQQPNALMSGGEGMGALLGGALTKAFKSISEPSKPEGDKSASPLSDAVPETEIGGSGAFNFSRGGPVNMKRGGKVGGKAKVAGDSYANDTVDAKLSPKEIVLPRSITLHPDAPRMAAEFVAALQAKRGMRS